MATRAPAHTGRRPDMARRSAGVQGPQGIPGPAGARVQRARPVSRSEHAGGSRRRSATPARRRRLTLGRRLLLARSTGSRGGPGAVQHGLLRSRRDSDREHDPVSRVRSKMMSPGRGKQKTSRPISEASVRAVATARPALSSGPDAHRRQDGIELRQVLCGRTRHMPRAAPTRHKLTVRSASRRRPRRARRGWPESRPHARGPR